MAKSFLLDPDEVGDRLRIRFRNQCRAWLSGEGVWPLRIVLGIPGQQQAMERLAQVRAWQGGWAEWNGAGTVLWTERRWRILGTLRLPEVLMFDTPGEVASFIGQHEGWVRATRRFREVTARWPQLQHAVSRSIDVLMAWQQADFERLVTLIDWLSTHPASNLYIRQLPIPGLDSKWLERRRKVVDAWLRPLLGAAEGRDFHALAGLRRPPQLLHMRLLDPALRGRMGGIGDIQAPVSEVATLQLPIRCTFIVENLQTGLAFEDLPGAVVFMGQGYAVEPFGDLPWLRAIPCHYWGDLDTHGFIILDRLREYLPKIRSLLMDEETLMRHRSLWGHEERPSSALELRRLDEGETKVFQGLRQGRWGASVRLEQERIEWGYAIAKLRGVYTDS